MSTKTLRPEKPTPAALAVDLIIEDLTDRRGLSHEWENIDAATIVDIKTAWIGAVQSAYRSMTTTSLPASDKAVTEAMVEAALAEWAKPNDRRDPIDIMHAALTAALSLPTLVGVTSPATMYQRAEEQLCTCGAAGSGEGHTEWCDWQSSEWRKWGDAFNMASPVGGEATIQSDGQRSTWFVNGKLVDRHGKPVECSTPPSGGAFQVKALDPKAMDALKNGQRQLDEDGIFVGVSRQALHELISAYEARPTGIVTEAMVIAAAQAMHDGPLGADDEAEYTSDKSNHAAEWCREMARVGLAVAITPIPAGMDRADLFLAWACETFTAEVATNRDERLMRFAEEAIELVMACDIPRDALDRIATRVYSRPAGDIEQEGAQCQVTLELLAKVLRFDLEAAADEEFERVRSIPKAEWGRRHAAKVAIGIATSDAAPQGAKP